MSSVNVLVGSGVLRPSLFWLLTGAKGRRVIYDMVRARDPEGFARLKAVCEQDPAVAPVVQKHAMYRCCMVLAAKGGRLADITVGDVLELLNAEDGLRADVRSRPALFKVLREMGVFRPDVPAWRALRRYGQLSVEELVDRYPIACGAVRDLLVGYLAERQPSVDYGTVEKHCYELVRCFWVDLEAHHPGIDTLRLAPEVASAWKARLRTTKARHPEALGERERTLQLPGRALHRPGLLPRLGRMGARRPGPLGAVGGALPYSQARDEPAQVRPPAQSPHRRPDP